MLVAVPHGAISLVSVMHARNDCPMRNDCLMRNDCPMHPELRCTDIMSLLLPHQTAEPGIDACDSRHSYMFSIGEIQPFLLMLQLVLRYLLFHSLAIGIPRFRW